MKLKKVMNNLYTNRIYHTTKNPARLLRQGEV